MKKSVKIIKENQQNISANLQELLNKEMVFRKLRKDTIGKSSSHPTWGCLFSKKRKIEV